VTILFGHPTGNPNSHQAALALFEAAYLEAFCVPWMPSRLALEVLSRVPRLKLLAERLARRRFEPLASAPKIQGRPGEWLRLLIRASGRADEGLSYEANDWLMRTMRRACRRPAVTAVHAYEDCALWQFEEAKRLGKACLYDLPIGYFRAWEETEARLVRQYADWIPRGGLPSSRHVRLEQKRREMELADLVLVPSRFVAETVATFLPGKRVAVAPYGVDAEEWKPRRERTNRNGLDFIFAGQCSLRKGIPLLLEAWRAAGLADARLRLVGRWQLNESKLEGLPPGVTVLGPVSRGQVREIFESSDVLVLPSYFEGRALVVGEAMAAGLPVLTTEASGADDLMDEDSGRQLPVGDFDALVASLQWFSANRDLLPSMSLAAQKRARAASWAHYRACVTNAVAPHC
jgi:glycosyltransferase involved in cell wall biosynthesis